ncbi:glycosyltransferase family 4 protein [Parapedobacter deserti]|uniref:Glycosyltransferase family 4 protein n=1 Tax=Parapedobacter deserti TaxID=1912957 RepID=A0ABV7JMI7_9SPHI
MRILIIHNHYQRPGGEDVVFEQERTLLSSVAAVETLTSRNRTGWRGAWQTLWSPWNVWAGHRLKRAIRRHRPDVIHIHNLHYAIGPIAIRIAKRHGIPVVMTLHNYRLLCPSATLFHNGRLFTDSLRAVFPWNAVRLGVHSHSVFKTFWLAFTVWLHKKAGTWRMVDRYIALTAFARQLFAESTLGLPEDQFIVKPNFVTAGQATASARGGYFLFIGRLAPEKGIEVLLAAFSGTDCLLRIAGDGPLRQRVIDAAGTQSNITYLGSLNPTEIRRELSACSALIFPSIWYEGMPMTLLEAFAAGTPVIASDLGAMQGMVADGQTGYRFPPGDAQALREKVQHWLQSAPATRADMASRARQAYELHYTADKNKALLVEIYASVMQPYKKKANR